MIHSEMTKDEVTNMVGAEWYAKKKCKEFYLGNMVGGIQRCLARSVNAEREYDRLASALTENYNNNRKEWESIYIVRNFPRFKNTKMYKKHLEIFNNIEI